MMFLPPRLPADKTPFVALLQYMVRWICSERVLSIKGFTARETADGKMFVPAATPPAGNAGLFFGAKIELPVAPYPSFQKQQVIHIQSTHAIVTTGIRDAANPSAPLVQSRPGFWAASQAVPAQGTVGGNPVWNLPQWPLPNPDNYDDTANFWLWLGDQYC